MMRVLRGMGVDWGGREVVGGLCVSQEAVVRTAGRESDSGIIEGGVRQG